LQRAVPGATHDLVEPTVLGLAGKERYAQCLRGPHLRRHLRQHRNAPGDVKATDTDRQIGGDKSSSQIDSTGKLIGLDPYQSDQRAAALLANAADDAIGPDPLVRLVMMSIAGPSTSRCRASSARPLRHARVLDGIAALTHWIGYPSSS
jgi:hypothetical protein